MKNLIYSLPLLLLACGTPPPQKAKAPTEVTFNASDTTEVDDSTENGEEPEYSDYANYIIVIADTGLDYYHLDHKMLQMAKDLSLKVDTMNRHYNVAKNLIALPDNDEDEIYAGDYYPRRSPSENLSLEYLTLYKNGGNQKMIALVCGIYENYEDADSALTALEKTEKKAFLVESRMFIGCIH
ncbi:MAG: hypothetical protein ACKOXB_14325 [Flavobacteriales bacterium]